MIIGVAGQMLSGKDTVGKIIQILAGESLSKSDIDELTLEDLNEEPSTDNDWQIVKFADAIKDIVCILIGCTREQLEDQDFKNSYLSDEWIRYGYADGFIKVYEGDGVMGQPVMNNKQCDKERYEIELKTNWQTAYKSHLTVRELLQYLGTDLFRNKLHNDVWVNALMSKYKQTFIRSGEKEYSYTDPIKEVTTIGWQYPNWIITDVRFPNELEAIKAKGGITVRVNRPMIIRKDYDGSGANYKLETFDKSNKFHTDLIKGRELIQPMHISETALDNATFDHTIDNNGSIEELIQKVKEILIKEKII